MCDVPPIPSSEMAVNLHSLIPWIASIWAVRHTSVNAILPWTGAKARTQALKG